MGIRFRCHHCERRLNIKAELAGRRGICPDCKGRFRIPLIDQEHSDSIAESSVSSAVAQPSSVKLSVVNKSVDGQSSRRTNSQPSAAHVPSRNAKSSAEKVYMVKPPGGGIYGPADLSTIQSWIAECRITPDTSIAPVGSSDWVLAEVYFPSSFAGR